MGRARVFVSTTKNAYAKIICKMVLGLRPRSVRAQVGAKARPTWKRIQDALVISLDQARHAALPMKNSGSGSPQSSR